MGIRREPVSTDRRYRSNRFLSDYGPEERWRHSGRILEPTERAGVMAARALEEHVLDVLTLRRFISNTQREAALRLKADFRAAGLEVRLIGSYNPARTSFSPFGSWNERTDAEEAAYQRWRNAVRSMGNAYHDTVISVACYDLMPGVEQMTRLNKGLGRLVKWYRLREDKN